MTDVLAKLDQDKKRRIINSAMKEFGTKGFTAASTNHIVKDAGISKGLLFHYFDTKQALFDYVEDFTFTMMVHRIRDVEGSWSSDMIDRVLQVTKIKMKVVEEFPDLYNFGMQMYSNKSLDDIYRLIEKYDLQLYTNMFNDGIDTSGFREELDPELTKLTIQRAIEKKSEELLIRMKAGHPLTIDIIYQEILEYSKFLRKAFYKKI